MHIAEGIIATEICVAADVISVGALYVMGRDTEGEDIPRMGFMGAALFAAALIHFPFAGTSIHLGLFGLAGILLGIRAFPVLFTVLLFQSLIFQQGGLISVGVYSLILFAGALAAWLIWRSRRVPRSVRAFLAGFVGIMLPAVVMAIEFELTGYGRGALFIAYVYSVVAVVEGALTLTVINFFGHVKPDLLELQG